jgi:c-di-GMP-binding flagellar brake protein YcgR
LRPAEPIVRENYEPMNTKNSIEDDWALEDKRAYERYSVEFFLCVYHRDSDALVGHVVDLSLGGLQLLSETPIAGGEQFRFRMDVSLESGRKDNVEFEAWSIWQSEDLNPGFYNAGFQFLDLTPGATQSIAAIIAEITASL